MPIQQVKSEFSRELLSTNGTKSFNATKTQEAGIGLDLRSVKIISITIHSSQIFLQIISFRWFVFDFCFLVEGKKELSDGELDSDNEEGKVKTIGNAGSNALANLMSYASYSEGEEAGIRKLNSTLTIAIFIFCYFYLLTYRWKETKIGSRRRDGFKNC